MTVKVKRFLACYSMNNETFVWLVMLTFLQAIKKIAWSPEVSHQNIKRGQQPCFELHGEKFIIICGVMTVCMLFTNNKHSPNHAQQWSS